MSATRRRPSAAPRDALDLGIGMIHQHFKLVDVFSATENIALSMGSGEKFDLKRFTTGPRHLRKVRVRP